MDRGPYLVEGGFRGEAVGQRFFDQIAVGVIARREGAGASVFEFDRQARGRVVGPRLDAFAVANRDRATEQVVGHRGGVAVGVFVGFQTAQRVVFGRERLIVEAAAARCAGEFLRRGQAGRAAVGGFGRRQRRAPAAFLPGF